jgi:lipid II:glycine glycyltransferase (peptidoglycan interpeptide bridge formation enzyme)
MRIPVSAFAEPVDLNVPYESTPETAIVDLPSWTIERTSGNHRRDIKKALRSDLEIRDAEQAKDGVEIFNIYHDTVKRHRGGLRYNESYFSNLVVLAQSNPHVRVILARREKKIAGFTVVVRHDRMAFYLHGGIRLEYRRLQPSALLLHEAIQWAKQLGCQCFNLMSSPADQKSLIWYKEKWGAETSEHRTYTIPLRRSYRIFQIVERLYRLAP